MNKRGDDVGGGSEIDGVGYGGDREYDSNKSLKGSKSAWRKRESGVRDTDEKKLSLEWF